MDTRRLILALVLSFAVLAAWSFLFPQPEQRPVQPAPAAPAAEPMAAESAPEVPLGDGTANEAQAGTGEPLLEAPLAPEEEILTDAERTVVVENDRFRAELSNRGGVIVAFELKDHESRDGGPVDLVRRRAAGPYPFALVGPDDAPLPLDGSLFTVEESGPAGARVVAFRYRGPAGDAEKRFSFGGGETFEVEVEVRRPRDWGLWLGPGLRNPTPEEVDTQFSERGGVYLLGGEVERVDAKKAEEPVTLPGGGLGWAGLDDHYFLTALIPRSGGAVRGVRYRPMLLEPAGERAWTFTPMPAGGPSGEQEDLPRDIAMVVEPNGQRLELRAFWGAKDLERLAEAAPASTRP